MAYMISTCLRYLSGKWNVAVSKHSFIISSLLLISLLKDQYMSPICFSRFSRSQSAVFLTLFTLPVSLGVTVMDNLIHNPKKHYPTPSLQSFHHRNGLLSFMNNTARQRDTKGKNRRIYLFLVGLQSVMSNLR